MGYLFLNVVLIGMIAIIYKRVIAHLRQSLLANFGAEIPVKLWNRGPF
jgi:hypothetical protein